MRKTIRTAAGIAVLTTSVITIATFAGAQPGPSSSPPASAPGTPHVVTAGPGQRALVVALDGELVRARACADAKNCDLAGGTALRPPESVRSAVKSAKVEDIELDGGKHVALVRVGTGARTYDLLLASVDAKSDTPKVLFSGFVGRDGESSTKLDVDRSKGKAVIKVTTRDALCGVDVLTASRTLDKNKLVMKDEPTPDPAGSARANAVGLSATPVETPVKRHRVLHARGSSSGRASAAVDGDPATAWIESEPVPGTKAFVSLGTSNDVPIEGFDITISPPADRPSVKAPKSLLFLTDAGAFSIALPQDALARGGLTFGVAFPKPIQTRCVGVVIDDAYAAKAPEDKGKKGEKPLPVRAFVSEVAARTAVDGQKLEELAKALGKATPDAKAREAVLVAEGPRGVAAIVAAYASLDGPARDRARRIVDAGDCEDKMPLYVPLLVDKDRSESDRARDWIRRCGKASGPALLAAIEAAISEEKRGLYAEEAALLSPDLVTKTLVQKLGAAKSVEERRAYRKALAKGALRAAGVRAIDAAIADPSFKDLGVVAKIDVLRALGASIGSSKSAPAVFSDVASATTEFRDRYLLLAPAADLARAGNAKGASVLESTLGKSEDPRLRARAAELAGDIPAMKPVLIAAIEDQKVRVREAALLSLTSGGKEVDAAVRKKLAERVEVDPWTFVRRAAAVALAGAPKDPQVDTRIAAAVDKEEQPSVRAELLRALGTRGARAHAGVIRERAFDDKEAMSVRLRAIEALGGVCDRDGVSDLTALALKGRTPVFEQDRKLAAAAISALVRIRPADLATRLQPMLAEGAAPDMRELTQRATNAPPANACK